MVHDFWNVSNAEVQQVEAAMFLKVRPKLCLFSFTLIWQAPDSEHQISAAIGCANQHF